MRVARFLLTFSLGCYVRGVWDDLVRLLDWERSR